MCIRVGHRVGVTRAVMSATDLLLAVGDAAAAIFEAKSAKVAPAAGVSAVERVAAVPVCKGHLRNQRRQRTVGGWLSIM